jgi:5-hydroxyisourate hydrolase
VSLTTHVLDLTRGEPAAGMRIVLSRVDDSPGVVVTVATNADGRTDAPLLDALHAAPGRYELAFSVGAYFAGRATPPIGPAAEPVAIPYLDVVPVHFGVAPGTRHLHVALLVTPWSYSTYRGS